jgi:hypothetical protein
MCIKFTGNFICFAQITYLRGELSRLLHRCADLERLANNQEQRVVRLIKIPKKIKFNYKNSNQVFNSK